MRSFKKTLLLVLMSFMMLANPTNASLFGCSADRQRCLNSCDERHRTGLFSWASVNLCKGRCLLSECAFYPRKEKKSLHPSERLKGFAI